VARDLRQTRDMVNQVPQSKLFTFATRLTLIALTFFSATPFVAANDLITDPGPGTARTSPGDMTFGYSFRAGDDSNMLVITALGIWDQGGDGLANSHNVGLWFSTGPSSMPIIASVTIPAGTAAPLSGEFRYVSLAQPLYIQGIFVIGASYVANDADLYRANFDPQAATFGAGAQGGIAFESGAGTGFAYPNLYDGIGQYVGPSAQFTIQAVPEPSVWTMIGVGSVLLVAIRFRWVRS
jgi:hypothetical protein